MPIDLAKPEPYFFAFVDRGRSVAIRVEAASHAAARRRFDAMTTAEKRARIVGDLARRDIDHVADFGRWLSRLLRRTRPAR